MLLLLMQIGWHACFWKMLPSRWPVWVRATAYGPKPAFGLEADAAPLRAIIELRQHGVRTGKTAGSHTAPSANPRDCPFQRRLNRRRVLVEIRPVEAGDQLTHG